jgi:hypothetical protein
MIGRWEENHEEAVITVAVHQLGLEPEALVITKQRTVPRQAAECERIPFCFERGLNSGIGSYEAAQLCN